MRQNSKMSNKSIFGLIGSSTTTTTMATTSTTPVSSTTTQIPIIINETSENNDEIIEELDTIEGFLTIIVIQLMLVIIYKLFKICKRGYHIHNEKIIRMHESTNPRI